MALKCKSVKAVFGSTWLSAQHGPLGSANPGITRIMLLTSVVLLSFLSDATLCTIILKSFVGLKRLCSKRKAVLLAVLFVILLMTT